MELKRLRPGYTNHCMAAVHMVSMVTSSEASHVLVCSVVCVCVCATGGGGRGLSAVSWVRTWVPHLQRNPQHAAERRRGVEGIEHNLTANYHSDGIVGILRWQAGLLSWCHKKIVSIVWLTEIMTFKVADAANRGKTIIPWRKAPPPSGFICIYFCNCWDFLFFF